MSEFYQQVAQGHTAKVATKNGKMTIFALINTWSGI